MPIEINLLKQSPVTVLSLGGELNAQTAGELEKEVTELLASGMTRLVIEAGRLTYISSAGLRVFLAACKSLSAKQGRMVVCGLQGPVRDIFELAGFGGVIPAHKDLATAEAACGK